MGLLCRCVSVLGEQEWGGDAAEPEHDLASGGWQAILRSTYLAVWVVQIGERSARVHVSGQQGSTTTCT